MYTQHISDRPIMIPGRKPARKSAPMETDMIPPHTTIRMLGGMMTPITEAHAIRATVKLESYPCFFIAGMRREPVVEPEYRHAGDPQGEGDRNADDDQGREDQHHQRSDLSGRHRDLLQRTARAERARSAMNTIQVTPASGKARCIVTMLMPVSSE